jgi:hypothetical protein
MKKIYNYYCTIHFLEKIKERRIDEYLIALCLAKGKEICTNNKQKYTITKKEIREAVVQGYIELCNYKGIETLTLIVKENKLITAFTRYSDVGLGIQ